MQRVLIKEWKCLWHVIDYVEQIWKLMNSKQVQYQNILREGNQSTDYQTNLAINSRELEITSFQ